MEPTIAITLTALSATTLILFIGFIVMFKLFFDERGKRKILVGEVKDIRAAYAPEVTPEKIAVGYKTTLYRNLEHQGKLYGVYYPCIVKEISIDGNYVRLMLDEERFQNEYPYTDEGLLFQMKMMAEVWFPKTSALIQWVTPDDGEDLQLDKQEREDIRNFLEFSLVPDDKKQKIRNLLNI